MQTIFKWLLFSSIPGIALTIFLSINWNALFSDVQYEASKRGESYYEDNKPGFIDDLTEKFKEYTGAEENGGDENPSGESRLPCRTYQGKVIFIADGDTITVSDDKKVQHKIRFRGIDAPETAQDFGSQSKDFLASLIYQKQVSVETCEMDRIYTDREISLVSINNESVNELQVKNGFAHYYKEFSANLSRAEKISLAVAENNAKQNRLGLWINPHPTYPQDFRRVTKAR